MSIKKIFVYDIRWSNDISEFAGEIDGILVNSNLFFHNKKNIYKKIINYGYDTLVDPMFYILQANIKNISNRCDDEFKIKPSILKMLKEFGIEIKKDTFRDEEKNEPFSTYIIDGIKIQKIISRMLEIQKEMNTPKSKTNSIFMEMINQKDKLNNLFMIPQFIPIDNSAISRNIELVKEWEKSSENKNPIPLYIDTRSYQESHYKKMVSELEKVVGKDRNIIVWVEKDIKTNFSEVIDHIKGLFSNISIRYASFDELIICQKKDVKLSSWISGFGYGEGRNILPVGGGPPSNKIYSPNKHQRLNFEEFYKSIKDLQNIEEYFKQICGCITCRKILKIGGMENIFKYADFTKTSSGRAVATHDSHKLSTKHYVWNKILEVKLYNEVQFSNDENLWEEQYNKRGVLKINPE